MILDSKYRLALDDTGVQCEKIREGTGETLRGSYNHKRESFNFSYGDPSSLSLMVFISGAYNEKMADGRLTGPQPSGASKCGTFKIKKTIKFRIQRKGL